MKFDAVEYQHDINQKIAKEKISLSGAEPISIVAGGKIYRVSANLVDFIEQTPFITPIPKSEFFVLGICHARGRVVTVVDLAAAMGESRDEGDKLIVLRGKNLAIRASLASEQDHRNLPITDFNGAALRSGVQFFNHLTQ